MTLLFVPTRLTDADDWFSKDALKYCLTLYRFIDFSFLFFLPMLQILSFLWVGTSHGSNVPLLGISSFFKKIYHILLIMYVSVNSTYCVRAQ